MEATVQQEVRQEKQENKIVRFFISLIWLAISIGVDVFAVMNESYLVGAIAEFVFFGITFMVPYLRKKDSYTRWFGWLALLQGAWLLYCMLG